MPRGGACVNRYMDKDFQKWVTEMEGCGQWGQAEFGHYGDEEGESCA